MLDEWVVEWVIGWVGGWVGEWVGGLFVGLSSRLSDGRAGKCDAGLCECVWQECASECV